MFTNNYILNLLNIKDDNIYIFPENIEVRKIKWNNYKVVEGLLTYNPEFYPCCGVINVLIFKVLENHEI